MPYALVAQLDRVTDYESVGRRFESCPAHHYQGFADAELFFYPSFYPFKNP